MSFGLMVMPAACLGLLQVLDRDVGLQRLVREVEADRLGEEVLQRHLVDRRWRLGSALKCIGASTCVPAWSPIASAMVAEENL